MSKSKSPRKPRKAKAVPPAPIVPPAAQPPVDVPYVGPYRGPGQPTKYHQGYCMMIVQHMVGGLSFESFAGEIGVHRDTLYAWTNAHPEFSDAKKIGTAASLLWWEKTGIAGVMGQIRDFSVGGWCFNMKVRHKWIEPVVAEEEKDEVRAILDAALRALDARNPK